MANPIELLAIKLLEGTGSLLGRITKPGGDGCGNDCLVLGRAHNPYQPKRMEDVGLSVQERLKHIYVLGATGSGKTKLLEHLIRQDILSGRGFCLIDPHGDLYQNILKFLASLFSPSNFVELAEYLSRKLVLIEPFQPEWTVGFNPLESEGLSPYLQTMEFMGIFRRLWMDAYWGPRMEELLRHTLLTLSLNGFTLLEAKTLMTDDSFREQLIANLPSGEVKEYWTGRYNQLSKTMQATYREPLLNRLSVFVADPSIRLIVGQRRSTIDFRRIMDQGKWLLVNLSKGHLKANADLLGALIIAKLELGALSRVDLPPRERRPFSLFVDEFQNFLGQDFETILSEARKYGLGLVLAHQNIDQLENQLKAALLGNALTQVFFRLSHRDAATLAAELSQKQKQLIQRRLVDLNTREAYVKKKGEPPRILKTVFVSPLPDTAVTETIKHLSFSQCARPRQEAEQEIRERTRMICPDKGVQTSGNALPDPYEGRFAPQGEFEEADL
jgi:hypothetical protein